MPDKRCTSLIKAEAGPLSDADFILLCRERCHLSIVNTSVGTWLDCALQRLEKSEARIAELEAEIKGLLLLIQHETDLPNCAANGVVEHGTDEGVYRAAMILEEARLAVAARDAAKGGE